MNRIVRLYMQEEPITISPNDNIENALQSCDKHHISHLLVEEKGKLIGIISKHDLLNRLKSMVLQTAGKTYSNFVLKSLKVQDFMTENPVSVDPTDDIDYAIELLLQQQFHILPVVNTDNEPIGVVTAIDLLKGYYHPDKNTND